MSRGLALAFLAICSPIAYAQAPPTAVEAAETVVAVELRSDRRLDRKADLEGLVAVRTGRPLDQEELRRTLRNLHASGLAAEVEAYRLPEAGGQRLVFALWSPMVVEEVRLTGELGASERELRRLLPQRTGEPLSESRIFRGVFQLEDGLRERGFLQAFVRVGVDTEVDGRTATVSYDVDSGRPATIGRVRIESSDLPVAESAARERLGLPVGSPYTQRRSREAAEALERWLIESGYRLASVAEPVAELDELTDEVELTVTVEAGPRFEVQVVGAEIADLRERDLLPFLGSERYDEVLLLQSVRRLRRHYQERGHYNALVQPAIERRPGSFGLRLEIVPGPQLELARLGFSGNLSFEEARLKALMITAPRRLRSGRLVDEVLQEDLANLRSFYLLQGFAAVSVGPAQVVQEGGKLEVTIPIVEGRRRRVAELGLVGVEQVSTQELYRALPLAAAGPFHPRLLDRALDAVRAFYEERGYADTQVSADVAWDEDGDAARVILRVLEGARLLVDRVVVRGNRRTPTDLILRVAALEPGHPIDTRALLEVQRRLYALGIFSEVGVRLAPASPFSSLRDVLVRVEEGRVRRVTYGVGYDSEDGPRGLLGLSHASLGGRAVSLRFDARAASRQQQARLLLRQPFLGRWNLPVTYSLFGIEEEQESFDSRRRGLQVETHQSRGGRDLGLLASYKVVEVENADPALEVLAIDRRLREVEIASLTPRWSLDRRDDALDPSRGWSSSLQTEYAFPAAGAEVEFFKLFGQQTGFVDLGRLGTLGASLRLGAIEPLGSRGIEDPTLGALASARVPISERFFAGGRSSHRAYRQDRLGVPCQTTLPVLDGNGGSFTAGPRLCRELFGEDASFPDAERQVHVGGNGLLLVNLDYRFPIAGAVGGTLFADAGNVWADWEEIQPSQLKLGAGFGLRYRSPIGPLRFEVGWKLDREPGEDPKVFFLSFGNPF